MYEFKVIVLSTFFVSLRTHMLQADNNEVFSKWVSALQSAISCAIHKSSSPRSRKYENGTPPSDSELSSRQNRSDSDRSKYAF